jgi:hypothetical protein
MNAIVRLGFDLAIPFETGGMDTSGFTVAAGTLRAGAAGDRPGSRRTGFLATSFWMAVSAVLGRSRGA